MACLSSYVSLDKPEIKITFPSTQSWALEEGHGGIVWLLCCPLGQ